MITQTPNPLPTLESKLLRPIILVMVFIGVFVVLDVLLIHRAQLLDKALVVSENIPWQVESIAHHEERYLESRKDYVLGQFATALSNLAVNFEVLLKNSKDEDINKIGRQAIRRIDGYQDQILEITEQFLKESKSATVYQERVDRGRKRLDDLMLHAEQVVLPGIPQSQRTQGHAYLIELWRTARADSDLPDAKSWEGLLASFEQYNEWAKKTGSDSLISLGERFSQIAGAVLENKGLAEASKPQMRALAKTINELHNRFLLDIEDSVEQCRTLLAAEIQKYNRLLAANLIVTLLVVLSMVFGLVITVRRRFTNPINRMIRTIQKIQKGSWLDRVQLPESRELEQLAKAFNEMADAVYESRRDLMVQRDRLEQVVEERTGDLKNVNRALVRSNKELDDFTYVVSHDLKEPLRGISAFSKFLVEEYYDRLDETGKEYINIISKSSVRMKRLIEDLLELSRISRRTNPRAELSLKETLTEIGEELALLIREKNATLHLPKHDQILICDTVRIKQVLTNLINNGLKFNRSEHPEVWVSVEQGAKPSPPRPINEPDRFITIAVKDNGIGIEEKHRDKVFEIFARLVSREEFEGTGAGLTICKKVVEDHGGQIWLDSKADGGTTFYVLLPKVAPQVQAPAG